MLTSWRCRRPTSPPCHCIGRTPLPVLWGYTFIMAAQCLRWGNRTTASPAVSASSPPPEWQCPQSPHRVLLGVCYMPFGVYTLYASLLDLAYPLASSSSASTLPSPPNLWSALASMTPCWSSPTPSTCRYPPCCWATSMAPSAPLAIISPPQAATALHAPSFQPCSALLEPGVMSTSPCCPLPCHGPSVSLTPAGTLAPPASTSFSPTAQPCPFSSLQQSSLVSGMVVTAPSLSPSGSHSLHVPSTGNAPALNCPPCSGSPLLSFVPPHSGRPFCSSGQSPLRPPLPWTPLALTPCSPCPKP
jgi:hypothetical protein